MPCASSIPLHKPMGWMCTGEDLYQVGVSNGIPIVAPEALLNDYRLMYESTFGPPSKYDNAGDHYHVVYLERTCSR
jgi:hypothetical protein